MVCAGDDRWQVWISDKYGTDNMLCGLIVDNICSFFSISLTSSWLSFSWFFHPWKTIDCWRISSNNTPFLVSIFSHHILMFGKPSVIRICDTMNFVNMVGDNRLSLWIQKSTIRLSLSFSDGWCGFWIATSPVWAFEVAANSSARDCVVPSGTSKLTWILTGVADYFNSL